MLLLGLVAGAGAQVPVVCPLDSRSPTGAIPPGSCFEVFSTTGQPLDAGGQQGRTVLCAGSTIEVRYCGNEPGAQLANIRYGLDCDVANTTNNPIITVPNRTGRFVILQLRVNPFSDGSNGYPATAGLQYSREFELRQPPTPAVQLRYCGAPVSRVRLTVTNAQANVSYKVRFGTGPATSIAQPADEEIDVPAGATTITVLGNYNDVPAGLLCEGSVTEPLSFPVAPAAPVLQRLRVQAAGLDFAFAALPADANFRYVLDDGTRTIDLPAGSTSYTLPAGPLGSCYRLRTTDVCNRLNLSSVTLCPVDLQATSINRQNRLTWTHAATSGVTGYEVRRNETELLATLPASAREYLDPAVTCGVTYRYQVVALSGPARSESVVRPVTTVADQAATPPLLSATFNLDNAVEISPLTAPADTASRLLVRRTLDNAVTDLPVTRRRPVLDQPGAVTPALVPCYTARLTDPCGNASAEGPSACPPVLAARAIDREENRVALSWSAPVGQGEGWRYRLLLLDAEGREIGSSALNAPPFNGEAPTPPADRQVLRYRLAATSSTGQTVYSNVVLVARRFVVAIPTAFTPNGDGLNDVLDIKGRFLQQFLFRLYDRNGVEVFRATERSQTWNGQVRGVQAAPQVFSYQFEATDETGQRIVQRGTVTLLR